MTFDSAAFMADTLHLSPGACCLWIRMLCEMDQAEPRGYLAGPDGGKPTLDFIADLANIDKPACHTYLCELHGGGLFSVSPDGIPYNRRMVREAAGKPPTKKRMTAKQKAQAIQANPPEPLRGLCNWWNSLEARGLVKGTVNPAKPSLEICRAWNRSDPAVREMLSLRVKLETQIEAGGAWLRGWLTLPDLLGGRNGNQELKIRKLLDGFYQQEGKRGGLAADTRSDEDRRLSGWGKIQ